MSAPALLKLNEELRKERYTFATPDESGHVAFQCPTHHYWYWVNKYPELGAADPVIARRAWLKFLNTDEGARYKVNPREGKRDPLNDGIIIR